MAQNFPTLAELKSRYLLEFESRINQDSPLSNKAFLRILSTVMAFVAMLLQREVINASKENFAITASRQGLIDNFGAEYDTPIKEATAAVLRVTIPAVVASGAIVPALTIFTGTDNGILYRDASARAEAAGLITLDQTALTLGTIGNLQVGQELEMSINISGVTGQTATITEILTVGAEAEETEVYRARILDVIRAPGGGGNSADYRNWAQEQEGVKRAFPYTALPFDDPLFPGQPPNRTVYIEADSSIDPDGIALPPLPDDTKATIITDPVTGQNREPLCATSDTLFVVSIRRTEIFYEVRTAKFYSGDPITQAVKDDIEDAVNAYSLSLQCFVDGLDIDADRNDTITDLSVSEAINGVLAANGATAEGVGFGLAPGSFLPEYQLGQGELAKNGGVTYA